MTMRRLKKIARMDPAELAWRTRSAAWVALDRARAAARAPRWDRARLVGALAHRPELDEVRRAASAGRWLEAHHLLSQQIVRGPQTFVIAPAQRQEIAGRVSAAFPEAAGDAAARAERILDGRYDLLGFRDLRFERSAPDGPAEGPDWHFDPVHERSAPLRFWSTVPFLSPSCGDHKIIWELNRHQHWLALGRAYWLSGGRHYRARALAELAGWLDANPPLMGINWASMLELAFRSLSWLWAANFFAEPDASDDAPWLVDLTLGLHRQLEQIDRNLSRYFSPNTHLLGEALALYVAGRSAWWLAGAEARARAGRAVLVGEIDHQIARDGGHRERSTHYHRYTLDFYLFAAIVARITGDPAAPQFERAAARLGRAARLLADSRGTLPHLGDDDGGATWPLTGRSADDVRDSLAVAAALVGEPALRIGPRPEEACWLLSHPALADAAAAAAGPTTAIGSAALPETGYYVSRSSDGDHLVVDAGPHGYQNAGHAHADALSLTFSVRGLPLLIDPGTGCYTTDPELRDRLRSTALHNTLTLDGAPQSVPAGPFHWRSAATGAPRRWRSNAGFDYFEGTHDGYRPLEHRRHLLVLHGDLVIVADLVAGPLDVPGSRRADVHWHLDRHWAVSIAGRKAALTFAGERVEVLAPHGVLERFSAEACGLGWQAPVYGRVEPATTLRLSHASSVPFWMTTVFGLDPHNEVLDVETMPVWAEAGALLHSTAVRVVRARGSDYLLLADPAPGLDAAAKSWRLAEFETDAAMLFCRTGGDGRLTKAAMVDGSRMRAGGARVAVTLPAEVPHLQIDLTGTEARLSGRSQGACVSIGSAAVGVAVERRTAARRRSAARSA